MIPPLNSAGLEGVHGLLAREAQERLVLLLNHVLSSEAVASERLKPHAGRRIVLQAEGWPELLSGLLPAPVPLALLITPAGLLERLEGQDYAEGAAAPGVPPADLDVRFDAADPLSLAMKALSGRAPDLRLQGDAKLAGDVNWIAENVRWDVAADIERFMGPIPATQVVVWGQALAQGLRDMVQRLSSLKPR